MPRSWSTWYRRFRRGLFAFSYDDIVAELSQVTLGRRNPRAAFEVEIQPNLEVRIAASPELHLAPDADEETRRCVEAIESDLQTRDRLLRRIAVEIVREQRPYFRGLYSEPRRLDVEALAAAAGASRPVLERCIRHKRVLHPRGFSRLSDLVDPALEPSRSARLSQPAPASTHGDRRR